MKLKEKQKSVKPGRSYKSQDAVEQEKATSKWTSSKVNHSIIKLIMGEQM